MSQKRYNQEFKQTVVELYHLGTSVSQLSSEYGVSEVTIYKWIKQYFTIDGTQELPVADVDAIQKENLRLKQEVGILKKIEPITTALKQPVLLYLSTRRVVQSQARINESIDYLTPDAFERMCCAAS